MKYKASLEEDSNGDLVLPFDEDMLAELGWDIGDVLTWTDNGDGTFIISKYEDSDSQRYTL